MSFTPPFKGTNVIEVTLPGGCGRSKCKPRIVWCDNTWLRWCANVWQQRYGTRTGEVDQFKQGKNRRWVTHQQEGVYQWTKLDGKMMNRTSTGTTNTMMWLTASGDIGCERRTWRDCSCGIVLTRCRLIDKCSHSRECTSCTTMWRPKLGWSLKISPILSLEFNSTAMVEICPCEKTRSTRLSISR
jgi:hypothetical protein